MKTWFNSWKRKGLDVEAELRAARPKAPAQLVRSISLRVNGRPLYAGRRARLGLVAVLGAACVAVLGATGGFSYAATSLKAAVGATTDVAHFSSVLHASTDKRAHKSSAGNQYGVAPHIVKVSPTAKIVGGKTPITVTGANIEANSVTVAGVSVDPSTNSPGKVIVVAPSHPEGTLTGPVEIVTDYGSDSSQSLTIHAKPTIGSDGLSQTTLEPGLTLTITGTGFTDATAVKFGTKSAKPASIDSDTQLTVIVPTGLKSTGTVTVTGPAGTSEPSDQTFDFSATAPTLKKFSPAMGVVAGQTNDATVVDITGTGFDETDTVQFDGVDAATQTFVSSTEFKATAPAGATVGKVSVVDTVGGAGISKTNFTPIKDPSVSGVSPSAAPASGGGGAVNKSITIEGSNLQGVGTTVTFPGVTAAQKTTSHKGSDTAIDVKVPKGATSGTLTVSNLAGDDSSASFTLIVLPSGITFDTTHHPAIPGDTLTIDTTTTGGFNGVTSVAIGKTVIEKADFTTLTGTEIELSIPDGTTTNVVSIVNAAGTAKTKDKLAMAAAPKITKSPASGVAQGQDNDADTLTFTGTGFNGADDGASTVVTFAKVGGGTVDATPISVDDKTLTVEAPATADVGRPVVSTDAGDATAKTSFTPIKNPTASSGSPVADNLDDFGSKIGGTITLDGTNLQGVGTTVTFPGVTKPQVTKSHKGSDTAIDVKVPKGATDGSLTISNAAGDTSLDGFLVLTAGPAPTSPTTVTHGAVAHFTGTGLLAITAVKVGKISVPTGDITVIDSTHVDVVIPSDARLGPKQVIVFTNPVKTGKLTVTVE